MRAITDFHRSLAFGQKIENPCQQTANLNDLFCCIPLSLHKLYNVTSLCRLLFLIKLSNNREEYEQANVQTFSVVVHTFGNLNITVMESYCIVLESTPYCRSLLHLPKPSLFRTDTLCV